MISPWPKHGKQQLFLWNGNTRLDMQLISFVLKSTVQLSTNVDMFSAFSASPDPGYFLYREHLESNGEAHYFDFDYLNDDEASLTSNRLLSCPFIQF